MQIIPVLDLKGGQVVRGVGGRRDEYRPVVSQLAASSDPVAMAKAFRDQLGLAEFYLADLDAIAGAPPSVPTYAAIRDLGCRLWVDAGVREPVSARPLAEGGVEGIVVGLETVTGPAALRALCQEYGESVIFSLDLKGSRPLGNWDAADALSIASEAVSCSVRRMIVLDLARVGMGGGLGTEELCGRLAEAFPHVEIIAGGGVRGLDDLLGLQRRGVKAALVASALHDGRLGQREIEQLSMARRAGGVNPLWEVSGG